jgi:putative sigma-54 modulation protein
MDIIVSGKHLEVTDAIRAYATDKTGKLPRYFDQVSQIEVLLDKQDHRTFMIEVIVHAAHCDPFIAHTSGDDLYACIDETVSKLERQLSSHKAKLRDHKGGK